MKKTIQDVDQIHLYDLDIENNHIYLMGVDRGYEIVNGTDEPGVEYVMTNRFIRNFNICLITNPLKPIIIHMKTCGGDWGEGMAIYDTIKSSPQPVIILNYTHARSMSSIIFQAATKRVMMPHSHFMFHQGSYGAEGTVKQVRTGIEYDKKSDKVMNGIYINRMKNAEYWKGKSDKQINNWLNSKMDKKEDVYLSALDTIKFGFADEIFYSWENLIK